MNVQKLLTMVVILFLLVIPVMGQQAETTDDPQPEMTVVATVVGPVSVVSGTVGSNAQTPVAPIDVNQLITGFLIFISFSLAGNIGQTFLLRRDLRDNVSKDAVVSMINPILQTTYAGWRQFGLHTKETPGIHDDILYAIGDVPLEKLVEKLRALGYELKPVPAGGNGDEIVDTSGTEDGDKGADPLA